MSSSPGGTPAGAAERAIAGLRERKKQRTRMALIDAALDLFIVKGYEATTIDEIVTEVDVSQRTFFRYFATKEDVALSFMTAYDEIMIQSFAALPDDHPPFAGLIESMKFVLHTVKDTGEDSERFRKLKKVIETTPALAAAHMAQGSANEKRLTEEIARRQGTDPDDDLRPQLVAAFFISAVRVGFEYCARHDVWEPEAVVRRVEESLTLAQSAFKEGWDSAT